MAQYHPVYSEMQRIAVYRRGIHVLLAQRHVVDETLVGLLHHFHHQMAPAHPAVFARIDLEIHSTVGGLAPYLVFPRPELETDGGALQA